MRQQKLGVLLRNLLILVMVSIFLAGCAGSDNQTTSPGGQPRTKIKLGTTAGPHEEIALKAKEIAAKQGLEIEVVPFNDGTEIDSATAEKKLDANAFQHTAFLDNSVKSRNLSVGKIADTYLMPMAIYSKKIKNIADLPDGATVALPGDPSNGARALMLFAKAGWIKLPDNAGVETTVRDIVDNPKHIQFKELDGGVIAPMLDEFDAAAINTHMALLHQLTPAKDGIYVEKKDNLWTCILAVRTDEKDDPVFQKLIQVYHSDEMRQFLLDKYQGSIVPGW